MQIKVGSNENQAIYTNFQTQEKAAAEGSQMEKNCRERRLSLRETFHCTRIPSRSAGSRRRRRRRSLCRTLGMLTARQIKA